MSQPESVATRLHIDRVRQLLLDVVVRFSQRAIAHDKSKLEPPEVELFDRYAPLLRDTTYGSDEYRQFLRDLRPALDHHYANNSHHPEHYPRGISGMSLLDLLEMICDWKAAGERHADGSIERSIEINQKRFRYSDELKGIFTNTAHELGYLKKQESPSAPSS